MFESIYYVNVLRGCLSVKTKVLRYEQCCSTKNSEKRWCFPSGPLTLPVSIQKLLTLRANHNDIDMIEKAPVSYQLGGSQGYVRAEVPYFPALELCNGMIGVSK